MYETFYLTFITAFIFNCNDDDSRR